MTLSSRNWRTSVPFPSRHTILAALLTAALLALPLTGLSPASAAAAETAAAPSARAATVLLHDAVAGLPPGTESRDGYQRSSFRHWIDADRVIWSQEDQMAA
jgi:hypothetical protein